MALSLAASLGATAIVQAQVTIPSTYVLPSSAADTTKPGFVWRFHQVTGGQNNSLAFTEAQLAGLEGDNIADPAAQGIAIAPGVAPNPITAPITFEISTVINVDKIAGGHGNFTPDDQMPGIDPAATFTDNLAAEVLTYLDLPAGTNTFGVNSDDGFRMTIGGANPSDHFAAVNVGQFDGGRGAADTIFTFVVPQAGIYATRLIWENGGGDANVEWFSVLPDGVTDVLINDINTPGYVKAYRAVTTAGQTYPSVFLPAPGDLAVSPDAPVKIVLVDGSKPVVPATVQLIIDGVAVSGTVGKTNNETTIFYKPAGLWPSASTHAGRLVYSDNGTPAKTTTNDWSFTVITYRNVVLPTPIYFENFESVTLGGLPTGWVATNATDSIDAGLDINDARSDSYLDWLVIDRNQVFYNGDTNNPTKVWEGGDPDGRVTSIAPGQIENGNLLTASNLMVGKFMYFESDERGGNQVGAVFTSNYDLTGKTNLWISFHSSYIQNQDSLGALEYSVDGGTNWLGVLYMLDVPDVYTNVDGSVDAVATLQDNVDGGAAYGLNYGAFIGAPITQALAPYIQGRINDDNVESHRVEFFPIPAAANKAKVQFRFTYTGTGSWYWAVDNFGIYSIPPVNSSPTLTISAAAGSVTISWPSAVTGFTLESTDNLTTPSWSPVSGVANNSVTVTIGAGNKFYRLHQ